MAKKSAIENNLRKQMEASHRLKVNQEEMKALTRQTAQEGS